MRVLWMLVALAGCEEKEDDTEPVTFEGYATAYAEAVCSGWCDPEGQEHDRCLANYEGYLLRECSDFDPTQAAICVSGLYDLDLCDGESPAEARAISACDAVCDFG